MSTSASNHRVLIKIIERKDIHTQDSTRKEQRIGDVLLVTETEPLLKKQSEISTRVKVVSRDKNLDQNDILSKIHRIGTIEMETVKVGISVPA